jgi:2-phospho-L-lactate/phosphoenolpyruvate guanylyltransferase
MSIPVVIPFKPINPKTRLSSVLEQNEREQFAVMMLRDVITAVKEAGAEPVILATSPFVEGDLQVRVLDEGLNESLNIFCSEVNGPLGIIMADLALIDADAVRRLLSPQTYVSIAPGRGGGTNAVFIRSGKKFHALYYGTSFLKHVNYFSEAGLPYEVVDSFRLHCDIDEKEDLVEILLHNSGNSRRYLESIGFGLEDRKSRIGVGRR